MKDGFYSIFHAGSDQDPLDEEAWGLAMLAHLKDNRLVGVDQGGCGISGSVATEPDGRIRMALSYVLKSGNLLPDGTSLEADHKLDSETLLAASVAEGEPQLVDIGLGAMFVRLHWLAEPA